MVRYSCKLTNYISREFTSGTMEDSIKVNGEIKSYQVWDNIYGLMGNPTMENIITIKRRDLVFISYKMEESMRDGGLMENSMG